MARTNQQRVLSRLDLDIDSSIAQVIDELIFWQMDADMRNRELYSKNLWNLENEAFWNYVYSLIKEMEDA